MQYAHSEVSWYPMSSADKQDGYGGQSLLLFREGDIEAVGKQSTSGISPVS